MKGKARAMRAFSLDTPEQLSAHKKLRNVGGLARAQKHDLIAT